MRLMLTWMSALILCGCLGRAKPDLLQARLRAEQERVVEVEQKMASAEAELKKARRESELLRAELNSGKRVMAAEYTEALVRVSKLQINSMMSGGLNRDDRPGDDALVAYISLVDDDGEVVKLPGNVELTLLDPSEPEPLRQVGQWRFSAEECRSKWTRGFTGSGFQFTVPLESPVHHEKLVLNAKLTTADDRIFDATQLVRVSVGAASEARARIVTDEPLQLDDINDPPPPPVGGADGVQGASAEWEEAVPGTPKSGVGAIIRDSTNWTKDEFPQRR